MSKCYFCGDECFRETVLAMNNKALNQSELFRVSMCADCAEAVKGALILLERIIPKKEKKDDE